MELRRDVLVSAAMEVEERRLRTSEAPPPPRAAVVYGLMTMLSVVWGSTWLVIAKGLRDLPPLTGAAARFVLAALVMLAIAPALARREGGTKPPFGVVFIAGLFQFAGNYALVYWVETVLPSGLVAVLWGTYPLMMALTGHFVTKSETLFGWQWLGLVVAFLGVIALFWTDVGASGANAVGMGLLLLLAPASVTATTALKAALFTLLLLPALLRLGEHGEFNALIPGLLRRGLRPRPTIQPAE